MELHTDTTSTCKDSASSETYTPQHSATYSPEDNKLRIYPAHRLDADTYARVKAAGFSWAPKQEIFVAPMWTPAREDLARELCEDIGDEDKSLTERAEERAERFDEYSDKRAADADRARAQVARIADGIPFGQPILVGHHSERHARKHAQQIESGMRRAVDCWETSSYWKARAAGAVCAAKYKERPDVRARRIKGIEADLRKVQKTDAEAAARLKAWEGVAAACAEGHPKAHEFALYVANTQGYDSRCFPLADYPRDPPASQYEGPMGLWSALDGGVITAAQAADLGAKGCRAGAAHRARWIAHYTNRLEYERAMQVEAGGLAADRFDLQPGGVISTTRDRRQVIVRVNRKDGRTLSVTVAGQSWTVGVEEITEYTPPSETAAAAVAAAVKVKPLCNYDGGASFARMTEAEYKALYEGSRLIRPVKATETHGAHRVRYISGHLSTKHGGPTAASYDIVPVFLTDAKVKFAPLLNDPGKPARKSTARKIAEAAAGIDTSDTPDEVPAPAPTLRDIIAEATAPTLADLHETQARAEAREARKADEAEAAPFEAMRQALKTGTAVQVVSAPQLFPTPAHVAARMVDLADIRPGDRVFEPSAGTGALLGAAGGCMYAKPAPATGYNRLQVHAVEINWQLAARLRAQFPLTCVHTADFLSIEGPDAWAAGNPGTDPGELGRFDVILMNPPFANADDIKHIQHARRFLAPGGRLVAICAAGPRQHAALQPLADSWEYLPEGTFEGTNVRAVLLTITN